MKNLLILLFAFMILAGLQCPNNSDPPIPSAPELTLPAITTKGLNTVGCKIDGKVWVPYSNTSVPFLYAGVARNNNWTFEFGAEQRERADFTLNMFEIYIKPLNKDTLFILTNDRKGNIAYYRPIDTMRATTYRTDQSLNNGYVRIIRFDSVQQIIAGTFQFTAIDSVTNIKHEITDGRFDLRFNY